MAILVIVESPAKCSKIESFLGHGYKCMASYGHLNSLTSLQDIDEINHFKCNYPILPNKQGQVDKLGRAIRSSEEVVLATDDDREGEAIAWHICCLFNLPVSTTKRIIFHEITKPAIRHAICNPTTINLHLVQAQQTRQILDMLLGYKLSPVLWKFISRKSKEGLSAGRCQTPALKLIYENEKEIKIAPGTQLYNVTGYFTSKNIPFLLRNSIEHQDNKIVAFLEESKKFNHIYNCSDPKKIEKKSPDPLITSSIQQLCNNEMNISPKETMKICQKLYEEGHITYMRTDSRIYSKEFLEKIGEFIKEKYGEEYIYQPLESLAEMKKKTKKKNKKDDSDSKAQEAHEAIRPTKIEIEQISEKDFTPKERKLYKLIWSITMESCMAYAKGLSIKATITAPLKNNYDYGSEKLHFLGWRIVRNNGKEENNYYEFLQSIKKNVTYKKIIAKFVIKNLKSHYNEAKIVQLLEEKGIGRPSTFSNLVDKIQERGYVKKQNVEGREIECIDYTLEDKSIVDLVTKKTFGNEKNKLLIQPVGSMVIEFLDSYFGPLFQYEFTKNMEDTLDQISKGAVEWEIPCENYNNQINKLVSGVIQEKKQSYIIDEKHEYMIGKYGPVIRCKDENGEISFKKVKKNLDYQEIKKGTYSLEELIDSSNGSGRHLGTYKESPLFLKKGKYGLYVEWDENKKSVSFIEKEEHEITIEDVISYLNKPKEIIRKLSESCSIRNGKFGNYVFYKTKDQKKPTFHSLQGFNQDVESCDEDVLVGWIEKKYNMSI